MSGSEQFKVESSKSKAPFELSSLNFQLNRNGGLLTSRPSAGGGPTVIPSIRTSAARNFPMVAEEDPFAPEVGMLWMPRFGAIFDPPPAARAGLLSAAGLL